MNQLEWGSDQPRHPASDRRRDGEPLQFDLRPQRQEDGAPLRHRGRHAGPVDNALPLAGFPAAIRRSSWTSARSGSRGKSKGWRDKLGVPFGPGDLWAEKGIVDGDNSGSASFDWAAAGRSGREDHVRRLAARRGAVLLPRRRQQRDVFLARRHRLHRRPLDLRRAVRHVQHGVGRGDNGRSAARSWRSRWRIHRRRRGRTPGSCPSTPRWASTSSTPRRTIFTPFGA